MDMMTFAGKSTSAGLIALLSFSMLAVPTRAAQVTYCSSQNTAQTDATTDEWQSNGLCTDKCKQDYAFAVIQFTSCYCSNEIPQDQQATSDCTGTCPGFPTELCGNQDKGLYVYLSMPNHQPSGTQGSSQPSSTEVEPSPSATSPPPSTEVAPPQTTTPFPAPPSPASTESSRGPETVVQTVTASPEPVTSTTSTQQSTTNPTTTTTAIPATPEPTTSAKPRTSLVVVTQSGQVVTQTVITTPTASSAPAQVFSQKGSSTGTIVGGVVGGVAGVAALAGSIFFLLWRRRQQRQNEDDDEGQAGVRRNTSTMSKAGLIRGEKMPQQPPPIATSFANTRRSSRIMDNESISPISVSDRRNSRHLVDQRLNPSAIFVLDNSSRGSVISMEDSRDYHRPLNIRNPDLH